jgi:hypothetical protein
MATKAIFNQLVLAFAPICNYDFIFLKEDEGFQERVRSSMLYIIAQRPELTFEALHPYEVGGGQIVLKFDICQKGNVSILHCEIPVYQNAFAEDIDKDIQLRFQYALPKPLPLPTAWNSESSDLLSRQYFCRLDFPRRFSSELPERCHFSQCGWTD